MKVNIQSLNIAQTSLLLTLLLFAANVLASDVSNTYAPEAEIVEAGIVEADTSEAGPNSIPQVEISSWIEPEAQALVSQQLTMVIEVATSTWFTGGTNIESFDVDGLVRLQRESFATNSTRRIAGQTWSVQRWEISIYPQQEGEFVIPALQVTTTVAIDPDVNLVENEVVDATPDSALLSAATTSENTTPDSIEQDVTVILESPAISISVTTVPLEQPSQTPAKNIADSHTSILVTPQFSITQSIDGRLEHMSIGDSFTRTVIVKAHDLAAMMLPELSFSAPEGLAMYIKPAALKDSVNRGQTQASRSQTINYVVEKQGSYLLPEIALYSYNPTNAEIESHRLDSIQISTVGYENTPPIEATSAIHSKNSVNLLPYINRGWLVVMVMLLTFISFWSFTRLYKRSKALSGDKKLKELRIQFKLYCVNGKYQQASSVLFSWLDASKFEGLEKTKLLSVRRLLCAAGTDGSVTMFDELMMAAHGPVGQQNPKKLPFENLLNTIEAATEKQADLKTQNDCWQLNEFQLN